MAVDGHLGYTKMAVTSQPVRRLTRRLVLLWGFRLSLDFYHRGLRTHTAVARNPGVSWTFFFIFFITFITYSGGCSICLIPAVAYAPALPAISSTNIQYSLIGKLCAVGSQQPVSSSPQALDLSFLAGLNPDLYHSIGHSLGILNDNGELSMSHLTVLQ